MNPMLVFSVLSALAAGVWSVWTWREDQEKERKLKRDQESALFVNSFIVALEELQSRVYGILEKDDLAFYKKEYQKQHECGSPIAIEILYRLSKYFGWTSYTFRYGPYTNDPVVIGLVRRIGETFENHSKFPGDAFRFTYEERVALGQAVVRRTGDVMGSIPVFEAITAFQFQEEMVDKLSEHNNLYLSRSVRRTLAAIDQVDQADSLEGVERLAVLQNYLLDLLNYLENMEGFSVSPEKRKKAPLRGAAADALPTPGTDATVVHQIPGRIRIKIPRLRTDNAYEQYLNSLLDSVDNVRSVKINVGAASVVIGYDPTISGMKFVSGLIKAIETGSAIP